MPEMQYVDGQFRHRLPNSVSVGANDIVVPRRAAACSRPKTRSTSASPTPKSLRAFWPAIALSSDRLMGCPQMCWAGPSSRLTRAPTSLITLLPSGGLGPHWPTRAQSPLGLRTRWPKQPSRVGAARPAEGSMTRLLPASSTITQVSANSLDMSDRAIRSLTQRTRSFAETFTDLLDPMLRPTTVTGYVGGSGRYIGIVRAKVADATDENVPSPISWPGHGRSKSSSPIKMLHPTPSSCATRRGSSLIATRPRSP